MGRMYQRGGIVWMLCRYAGITWCFRRDWLCVHRLNWTEWRRTPLHPVLMLCKMAFLKMWTKSKTLRPVIFFYMIIYSVQIFILCTMRGLQANPARLLCVFFYSELHLGVCSPSSLCSVYLGRVWSLHLGAGSPSRSDRNHANGRWGWRLSLWLKRNRCRVKQPACVGGSLCPSSLPPLLLVQLFNPCPAGLSSRRCLCLMGDINYNITQSRFRFKAWLKIV